MARRRKSRFDAETVERLATVNGRRRLEMHLSDSERRQHVVSLPLDAAVALGRLICDMSESTPFLKGEAQAAGAKE